MRVWKLLAKIPKGKVTTYGELARALHSKAYRAVGNACNKNPHAPKVPCHRVVASDGKLGGYAHGSSAKIRLLEKEGIRIRAGRLPDFDRLLFRFPRGN